MRSSRMPLHGRAEEAPAVRGRVGDPSETLKTKAIADSVCKEVEPSPQIALVLNLPSAKPSISALFKPGCSQSICRDPGRHVLRFEVV